MKDQGVGMVGADDDDEIGVIGGGLIVLIAYLLRRGGVVGAVEVIGLFEIKGQKVGEFFGVIPGSLLISFYRLPKFPKVHLALLQLNRLLHLSLEPPIARHLKEDHSV